MKILARILVLLLVISTVLGVSACTTDESPDEDRAVKSVIEIKNSGSSGEKDPIRVTPDYTLIDKITDDSDSWGPYKEVLGDFYAAYLAAGAQTDMSARYTLQAIAEAKLLESGAFLPTTSNGGYYVISRVVGKTTSAAMFGTDSERFNMMLLTNETIRVTDREELNKIYAENVGTGTYRTKAAEYLVASGYTLKSTFNTIYSDEPQTWDVFSSNRSVDYDAIVNTYDNLIEYDCEGRMLGALAVSCEVSEDGTEYTFKLREGVKWVTSDGEEYAEVTAEDFVTGLKYIIDSQGGDEYLAFGVIKNAREYASKQITDFSQVGVTAVDKYTLKYTLASNITYFPTMLTYNLFAPLNGEFLAQEGKAYGTSPEHILYCGPYIISDHTAYNRIVYTLNQSYYAKDDVTVKTVTCYYNDSSDNAKAYNDFKAGTIDSVNLNTTTIRRAKIEDLFDEYAYVSSTDSTSYGAFINVMRAAYTTTGNETDLVSEKTDAQKEAAKTALMNRHFRLAIVRSINRATYNAAEVGDSLAEASLRNTYTPGTFVSLERDVIIPINGVETTFEAGTMYGAIVQAQLDADGCKITVWDPTLDHGIGSSDAFDGWYDPEEAVKHLELAIAELAEEGLEITVENPIVIDYPYQLNGFRTVRANALKNDIETSLGGLVIVNTYPTLDLEVLYAAGQYCESGSECNYDIYDISGWGPDYGDPATYLDTMLPMYAGEMTRCLGLY